MMAASFEVTDAVMKLQIGEDCTRRIPIKALIDSNSESVSYQKLFDTVVEHHRASSSEFPQDTIPQGFQVRFSYTDEDGDVITISTDDELADAFKQLHSKAIPVLRVVASTKFASPPAAVTAPPTSPTCMIDPFTGEYVEQSHARSSEHRRWSEISQKKDKKQAKVALEKVATVLIATADHLVHAVDSIQPLPPAAKKELMDQMNQLVATTDAKFQKKQVLHTLESIAGVLISTVDRLVTTVDGIQPLPPAAKKELVTAMNKLATTTGTKLQKDQVVGALETVAGTLITTVDKLVNTVDSMKPIHHGHEMEPTTVTKSENKIDGQPETTLKSGEGDVTEKMKKKQILVALEALSSILLSTVDRLVNTVETLRPHQAARKIVDANSSTIKTAIEMKTETLSEDSENVTPEAGHTIDPNFVHTTFTCDGCLCTPIVGTRYHSVNLPDVDLCEKCMPNFKDESVVFKPVTGMKAVPKTPPEDAVDTSSCPMEAEEIPNGFDSNFIHGRHTCDCCLISPIIGLRFHATNLPDYDLCSKCVVKYKGKNIKFEPVELDRDRNLQVRWKQHHGKHRFRRIPKPDFTSERYDEALKEALRRSLQEVNQKRADADSLDHVNSDIVDPSLQLKEEESNPPPCEHEVEDSDDASTTVESCVVVATPVVDDVKSVESENENKNIATNDSWEVLHDDGRHLDHEVGLAAQVLGSTLFLSNMSVNSQMSASIATDVTPGMLSRWDKELTRLHEIGFVDDQMNVDALETLEAANIGIESVDPVTIEQVVNYLIKKKSE